MDSDTARWLVSPQAAAYIAQAHEFDDPSSLKAASLLRRELSPDKAAAVADLECLRRKGTAKFGDIAQSLFLTHDGLEQATRFPVAQWRAGRMSGIVNGEMTGTAGCVIDAGCGVGIDALAMRMAGMEVTGIEMDPVTAVFAHANLGTVDGPDYEVRTETVEDFFRSSLLRGTGTEDSDRADAMNESAPEILAGRESGGTGSVHPDSRPAIFLDPARRTAHGRSWNVEDLSPSWEFVLTTLRNAPGLVVVKLAPGFPRSLLPDNVDVTWVSHKRNLVETTLWSYPGMTGKREAVILETPETPESRLLAGPPPPPPGPVGEYILEPDPAVIRAGAIGALARMTGTHPMAGSIAYLTGPDPIHTRFATAFRVLRTLDFSEKELRAWVHNERIGVLEIKQRGLDVDPATLRRTLKPKGERTATIILAPTLSGAKVFIVERIL